MRARPDDRVPTGVVLAGALIGAVVSVAAFLWAGSHNVVTILPSVEGVLVNNALFFGLATSPVALLFALWWPAWSWRWGLVTSCYVILAAIFMAVTLLWCPFGCVRALTWQAFIGTMLLPIIPCAAAALGARLNMNDET